MTKRTTSAVWVKGIADMLAGEGLDARALLVAAGIDPAALEVPDARLPTEKISHLWELAVERSGNQAIGLAQHNVVRPASFDVVGYTMMSCANLRSAFERLIRYLLILSDAFTMTMDEEEAGYRVTFVLLGGDRPIPRQRIEFILVTLIGFCRWISGRNVNPIAIELPYPAPIDPVPYENAFPCPGGHGSVPSDIKSVARGVARTLCWRISATFRSCAGKLPDARDDHPTFARRRAKTR